jgi:putative ABC transport system permease protein
MHPADSFWRQLPPLLQVSLLSLWRHKWASATVAACVMLVVLVLLAFLAMADGFERSMRNTGETDVAVLLAPEASSEAGSRLTREQTSLLATAPGIARGADGPQLSAEFSMTVGLPRSDGGGRHNITLRGMQSAGLALRPGLRLVQGRLFERGRNEIIIGRRLAEQGPELKLGATTRLAGRDWTVVGVYALDAALFESEAWGDITAVQSAYGRANQYQSVRARLAGADAAAQQASLGALAAHLAQDPRLKLALQTEREFYQRQSEGTHNLMVYLGWPLAAVLALGTVAGTFNTLSIAVQARRRSLKVLNLLGFRAAAVSACVLLEAVLLSALGALVGVAIGWLAFNGVQGSTVGGGFTSVNFNWQLGSASLLQALGLALAVGTLGGLVPAWRTLRSPQGAS